MGMKGLEALLVMHDATKVPCFYHYSLLLSLLTSKGEALYIVKRSSV